MVDQSRAWWLLSTVPSEIGKTTAGPSVLTNVMYAPPLGEEMMRSLLSCCTTFNGTNSFDCAAGHRVDRDGARRLSAERNCHQGKKQSHEGDGSNASSNSHKTSLEIFERAGEQRTQSPS